MRIPYGYTLKPDHPLRRRLSQGPPAQPDPSVSTLPTYYGPPYSRFFPLLRPSGALGVVSQGSAPRTAGEQAAGGPAGTDAYGTPLTAPRLSDEMPWLFAPLDAFPFVVFPAAAVGPVANGSSAIVVTLPQLPRGRMARITRFGNNASVLLGVTWTFLVRSQPTAPIINFPSQYGLLTDPRPLPDPGTILRSGDDFAIQVTNNSGAAITAIQVIAIGYQWTVGG